MQYLNRLLIGTVRTPYAFPRYLYRNFAFVRLSSSVCRLRNSSASVVEVTRTTLKYSLSVVPLVFEHFGFWGPAAEEYLDQFSKKSKDFENRNNEADFSDRWRRQLSVMIQKCTAKIILKFKKA